MRKKRLMIIVMLLLTLLMFSGCEDEITGFEITSYPNRLVYVQNVDTKLDLSGGKYILLPKNDQSSEYNLDDQDAAYVEIEHSIDFTKPGIYIVKLYSHNNGYAEFPVQVVSKEQLQEWLDKT